MNHKAADGPSRLRPLSKDKMPLKVDLWILAGDTSDDNNTNVYIVSTSSEDVTSLIAKAAPAINAPPTENRFIVKQASDLYCEAASIQIGHTNSGIHMKHHGLLQRETALKKGHSNNGNSLPGRTFPTPGTSFSNSQTLRST